MGWWIFVRSAIEALTRPRADVAHCDRTIERLTRDSLIGGAMHRSSDAVGDAWASSRLRALLMLVRGDSFVAASAWRTAGWIVVVASATVLGLQALKPTPAGPLWWVLPSVTGGAGLLAMMMAAPLARAAADRRERTADGITS